MIDIFLRDIDEPNLRKKLICDNNRVSINEIINIRYIDQFVNIITGNIQKFIAYFNFLNLIISKNYPDGPRSVLLIIICRYIIISK